MRIIQAKPDCSHTPSKPLTSPRSVSLRSPFGVWLIHRLKKRRLSWNSNRLTFAALLSSVLFSFYIDTVVQAAMKSEVQVEYKINRLQGLVDFALALSGEPHQAPGILESFNRSKYNKPEVQKWIEAFAPIHASLANGYQFQGTPSGRRDGAQVLKLIQTQSLFATSLQDLSTRSLGLLPLAQHRDYFALLEKLEPIYNEVIWKTSESELKAHQVLLTRFAKKADLNRMFMATEKLYRGAWPKGVPFSIGLYPVPYIKDFKNYTISQSIGSIEEHGVLIGAKNLDASESFGVIFHELCHSIYNTQSPEFMQKLDQWFAENPSPYRVQAQNWFNEAIATAIGNGWANARINGGKLSGQNWYSEPIIDKYAKAIYPLINQGLNHGGTIDEAFVGKVIDAFAHAWPDALKTYSVLMNNIVFLHNGKLLSEYDISSGFNRNFMVSSLSSENSMTARQSLQTADNRLATLVLQFTLEDLKQANELTAGLPYLHARVETLKKLPARSVLTLTDDSRVYIVIVADSAKDFADGLSSMAKSKTFDGKIEAHSY